MSGGWRNFGLAYGATLDGGASEPFSEAVPHANHPRARDGAAGPLEQLGFDNGKPADADQRRHLQACLAEVFVAGVDSLVESFDGLVHPRGHHSDEPIIVMPWHRRDNQHGTKFPCGEIGPRKTEQDEFAGAHDHRVSRQSLSS